MIVRKEKTVTRTKLKVKNSVLKKGVHYLTSDYKTRNSNRKTHSGIDMIGDKYAADYIVSIQDGVVSKTGYSKTGSGYYVYVTHGNYLSLYCHMKKDSIVVKKGQKVKKGTVLGYMGKTGNATGVHLHFAIKYNNNYFDSLPYLEGKDFVESDVKYVYNCTELNIRKGRGTKYQVLNSLPAGSQVKVLDLKSGWAKISDNSYVSSNYLTSIKPKTIYSTKKVTAEALNVRYGAGTKYKKWTTSSPLPKNTVVAIVKTGKWIKISKNKKRWVSANYVL